MDATFLTFDTTSLMIVEPETLPDNSCHGEAHSRQKWYLPFRNMNNWKGKLLGHPACQSKRRRTICLQ
jgi:hypothetical protein